MKLGARDPLFHRSILFVEFAVLLAIALCSGMLLASLNDIDNLLLQTYQTTGAQRIRSVFQNMGERVENLRESLLATSTLNEDLGEKGIDAGEVTAVQDLLKEDGNALNLVLLENGQLSIGPNAVGPELEREIQERFGLTSEDLWRYVDNIYTLAARRRSHMKGHWDGGNLAATGAYRKR